MVDYKFGTNYYAGMTGLLSEDGRISATPQGCKDWVHDAITHYLYPEYASAYGIAGYRTGNKPSYEHPEFLATFTVNTPDSIAATFCNVINDLEALMGLEDRTEVGFVRQNTSLVLVARAHNFWIKSPVAVSFILSMLRSANSMDGFSQFWPWMESAILERKAKVPARDGGYLRVAHKFNNIAGFLNHSLVCMNREGYSDYLLSSHSRGIAWYVAEADNYPVTEQELIELRVKARLKKDYKPSWGAGVIPLRAGTPYDLDG